MAHLYDLNPHLKPKPKPKAKVVEGTLTIEEAD
jgi:hypothetical protein